MSTCRLAIKKTFVLHCVATHKRRGPTKCTFNSGYEFFSLFAAMSQIYVTVKLMTFFFFLQHCSIVRMNNKFTFALT